MYFITIDANGYVTGLYNGDRDYVHRITGEPIAGAVKVPDGAILIGEPCVSVVRSAQPLFYAKWDGSCVIIEERASELEFRKQLEVQRLEALQTAEVDRINNLTLAEVKAELGVA